MTLRDAILVAPRLIAWAVTCAAWLMLAALAAVVVIAS